MVTWNGHNVKWALEGLFFLLALHGIEYVYEEVLSDTLIESEFLFHVQDLRVLLLISFPSLRKSHAVLAVI